MKRKTIKTIIGIAILVLILIIANLILFTGNSIKQDEIVIGFIGPLSGDAAVFGMDQERTMKIVVDEINSNGGVNGKKIRVIYEDGKCTGKDAATAAQKLINIDEASIIIPVCSSETLSVAPIAEENKVITFTALANNPDISYAGDYVFRNSISDAITAKIMAERIYQDYKKVGIIYEETSYAVGLKNAFGREFKKLGGEIIEEGFAQSEKDVSTQVTKVIGRDIEVVFVDPDSPATGMAVLKQLKQQGYEGEIYGNFFGGNEEVQKSIEAEGMIFFGDPIIKDNNVKQHVLDEYRKRFGENPAFEYYPLSVYDVVYILKEAVEEVGENNTDIKNYLYEIEFSGALGSYSFDSNGDIVGVYPSVKMVVGGVAVVIG